MKRNAFLLTKYIFLCIIFNSQQLSFILYNCIHTYIQTSSHLCDSDKVTLVLTNGSGGEVTQLVTSGSGGDVPQLVTPGSGGPPQYIGDP